jgi:hypothetical protein
MGRVNGWMGEAAEPTTDQRPPSFQPTRVTELLYSPTNRKRRSLSCRARAYSEIGCRSHRGRYRNRYRNRLLLSTRRPIVDSDTDPDPEQTADTQISMPLRGMTGIPLPHPQCRKRSPLRVNLLCALPDLWCIRRWAEEELQRDIHPASPGALGVLVARELAGAPVTFPTLCASASPR